MAKIKGVAKVFSSKSERRSTRKSRHGRTDGTGSASAHTR